MAPLGGKLKTFSKKNGKYIHNGNIGANLPFKPQYGSTVSGIRNEIIENSFDVSISKSKFQDSILNVFAKSNKVQVKRNGLEPLFLKAHETYEINLIKDVDYLVRLPGEYMLFYELGFSLTD
ncbi:MAG: hypothetical protein ACQUHE_12620, partial [Bacteroidia bacterium]